MFFIQQSVGFVPDAAGRCGGSDLKSYGRVSLTYAALIEALYDRNNRAMTPARSPGPDAVS